MTAQASVLSIGSATIPELEEAREATPREAIDEAVETVYSRKDGWVAVSVPGRVALIEELSRATSRVAKRWVSQALAAKGLRPGTHYASEEWLAGPMVLLRNLRLLAQSLRDIERYGRPLLPGKARTRPDGQVVAPVFPTSTYDKLLFGGFSAEVWMDPSVTLDQLSANQAAIYRGKLERGVLPSGKVALVLGAGNVASIGPTDTLYKLFVEDHVVVLKMNPVNEYLGPIIEEAFAVLIDRGFLRVVYGGVEEGAWLCEHELVDEIHITGSDKTHDAIVYGLGAEGARRKAAREPRNTRRVTSELGNVSPVIVVPGPWSTSDLEFQGQNIASMLTNNAGFNCNAARVIIQHQGWEARHTLLDEVRQVLSEAPTRPAYYPGAEDRHAAFVEAHPEAELYGEAGGDKLPWTLIPKLDPDEANDICFTTEAFCGVFGEVALPANDPVEFIARAVELANEGIWGTLSATIIVHPESLTDPRVRDAVEQAIADLRYGTVAVNHWSALSYGVVSTTWGAFPGHPDHDIQSGRGVVHNTFLFDKPQKSVLRGPFRVFPKPPWFVTNKRSHELAPKLTSFEAKPGLLKLPGLVLNAVRG